MLKLFFGGRGDQVVVVLVQILLHIPDGKGSSILFIDVVNCVSLKNNRYGFSLRSILFSTFLVVRLEFQIRV